MILSFDTSINFSFDLAATLKCLEKICVEEGGTARGVVTESVSVVQLPGLIDSATDKTLAVLKGWDRAVEKPLSSVCRLPKVGWWVMKCVC